MNKLYHLILFILLVVPTAIQAQVGIGTLTPEASAELEVSSTTRGLLPPRMTEIKRDAIAFPTAGLMIYCTNCGLNGEMQVFNGIEWTNMIGGIATLAQIIQMGNDIDGEGVGDLSGWSVSLSANGNRVAIGAYQNDNSSGTNAGHVRVYDFNGTDWIKQGDDIDGEAGNDQSGFSVALSSDGNRVAIGALFNDDNGPNAGQVRIYEWNGSSWLKLGNDIDGEGAFDQSGRSVSLSSDGSRVAIGAPFNSGNGSNAGQVRIYEFDGFNWIKLGADIDGESVNDQSGMSVSISSDGNRVAIGAPSNDGNGSNAGQVRIYEFDGFNWVKQGADLDGEAVNDQSGTSVFLSSDGNRVAIGAPFNNGNGSFSGHVRIYDWDGSTWNQLGLDIEGEAASDQSGISVSMSANGSRVVIGASFNDSNGVNAGHARVYEWDGSNWIQFATDFDGESTSDQSGTSVSMSSDGSRVAIGAPFNQGNGSSAGHVRVYDYD